MHNNRHSCTARNTQLNQYLVEREKLTPVHNFNITWPELIKINTVSANFNNTRPSLILNN